MKNDGFITVFAALLYLGAGAFGYGVVETTRRAFNGELKDSYYERLDEYMQQGRCWEKKDGIHCKDIEAINDLNGRKK